MRAPPPPPSDSTGVAAPCFDADWLASRSHTPYFCEENIWHLCRDPAVMPIGHAVLVINRQGCVPTWAQRAALPGIGPIMWDYHAVIVVNHDGVDVVVDLDCTVGPVLPVAVWLEASFRTNVRAMFMPSFRVIPAAAYVALLATDRRHMMGPNGRPLKPLPPWPPPGVERGFNIDRLTDVDDDIGGDVIDIGDFVVRFADRDVLLPLYDVEATP